MPAFPSLAPALAFLQAAAGVTISTWIPAAGPAGHANGTWGAPAALAKPYTVDTPTGSRAVVQLQGGEVVTADLVIYCTSAAAPADAAPGGKRQPRITWQGKRYRSLGKLDTAGLSAGPGTVGIVCTADNGGET